MIVPIDYASASTFDSTAEQAQLGFATNLRRPVRFHGRLKRNIPMFRFALRALGEVIWSNDLWGSDQDYLAAVLDPVITVHPDRLFFEAFSQDQSAYALLIARRDLFETEGEVITGTTNVDFTAWLWGALNELRSSRDTWLRVGPEGFEVKTTGAGGRFERKVDLPDEWVRGFLQVSSGMALPGTRLSVRPADLLAALRFLRYQKAKISPRALRYEFIPGEDARLVLEPWEEPFRLRGADHGYTEPRVIRTWGRRRLKWIEPLLPFAERVDIYLKGRGLPSFYAVHLPDLTFLLGLSGWSEQNWTGSGSFDLLGETKPATAEVLAQVENHLRQQLHASPRDLAHRLNQPLPLIEQAAVRLGRQGKAMWDVEAREYRWRELFEQPVDEAKLFPPDERVELARPLVSALKDVQCEAQETRKTRSLKTPEGSVTREVIFRDWRVRGTVGGANTEIVVGDSGRIIFGTCSCPFFQENLMGRGPCEHMIALHRGTTELRQDLPTSQPVSAPPPAARSTTDKSDTEESEEEDFDESNTGEEHERR